MTWTNAFVAVCVGASASAFAVFGWNTAREKMQRRGVRRWNGKGASPYRALVAALADDPENLPLTCLVCRGPLVPLDGGSQCADRECGMAYPDHVTAIIDPADWRAIQLGRFYCLECESSLPRLPVIHVDENGDPKPCPKHGPARQREKVS